MFKAVYGLLDSYGGMIKHGMTRDRSSCCGVSLILKQHYEYLFEGLPWLNQSGSSNAGRTAEKGVLSIDPRRVKPGELKRTNEGESVRQRLMSLSRT